MKTRAKVTIGILLILAGLLVGFEPLRRRWMISTQVEAAPAINTLQAFADAPVPEPESPRLEGKPVSLEIPSLNIKLSVADGVYNTSSKTWSLSLDKAHYALMTPMPNNKQGNTFIYGHNRKNVFAALNKIQPESELIITTDNNLRFVYVFKASYETNPYDDSLFKYDGAPIVTLQTCSGLWYQNRQLFTFTLRQVG